MGRYNKKKSNGVDGPILLSITIFFALISFRYSVEQSLSIALSCLIVSLGAMYAIHRYKIKRLLISGIDLVDKFQGEEFELFLLAHFKNLDYKGNLTPATNDYGADLILSKDNEKIVVQAKRWKSKVGIEAIQQIIGAKEYYKATKALVVTNSFFTPNAVNLAESSNVELWDRNKLLEVMYKANGREIIQQQKNAEPVSDKRICKYCNSELILRNGRRGKFYGCPNYPSCKYTENI